MNSTSEPRAARALKPYRAYKDSGVDWLGKVPSHWEVKRLKHICRLAYGDALAGDVRHDGPIPVLGSNGRVGFHNSANTNAPCIVIGRKGSFGKLNYSHKPVFAIDTTFFIDRRVSSANIRWLFFLLGLLRLDEVTRDSAVPGLDREETYQRIGVLPPLLEQASIVRFLDHADRRIRRYIRAKQNLIALLEEQKQALIHEAVTGQIDVRTGRPYPAYKDSGIALGKVPVHWGFRRLKSLVERIDQGVSPQAENYVAESGSWGVLKAGCVNRGKFRDSQHKRLPSDFVFDPALKVQLGDVLVSRASGSPRLVGSVGRVSLLNHRLILSDKTFRPVFTDEADPDFMVLAMNGLYYRQQVERAISGAEGLANNLPLSSLRAFRFAIPTLAEQREVVRYVATIWSDKLGRALSRAQREVSLVAEYRVHLIADAVTGKLDVRATTARLPDLDPLTAEADLDDSFSRHAGSAVSADPEEGSPVPDVVHAERSEAAAGDDG